MSENYFDQMDAVQRALELPGRYWTCTSIGTDDEPRYAVLWKPLTYQQEIERFENDCNPKGGAFLPKEKEDEAFERLMTVVQQHPDETITEGILNEYACWVGTFRDFGSIVAAWIGEWAQEYVVDPDGPDPHGDDCALKEYVTAAIHLPVQRVITCFDALLEDGHPEYLDVKCVAGYPITGTMVCRSTCFWRLESWRKTLGLIETNGAKIDDVVTDMLTGKTLGWERDSLQFTQFNARNRPEQRALAIAILHEVARRQEV
jgi:hypothetical protein